MYLVVSRSLACWSRLDFGLLVYHGFCFILFFNSKPLNLKRWSFEILPPFELKDINKSGLDRQMLLLLVDMIYGYNLW